MPRTFAEYVERAKRILDVNWTQIDDQPEEAARSFVNASEVLILPEERKVLLSEIFRWYERDFGGRSGMIDFIFDYLVDEKARFFFA
jgi:hypothetical protein